MNILFIQSDSYDPPYHHFDLGGWQKTAKKYNNALWAMVGDMPADLPAEALHVRQSFSDGGAKAGDGASDLSAEALAKAEQSNSLQNPLSFVWSG